MSVVTSKGQATIPKYIRDFLGIVPGETEVDFLVVGNKVELVNKQTADPFTQMRGITKDKLSTDQIMALTRG